MTAYQSSSISSPTTCSSVSQTRTCNDGTLSGSYTSQSCTNPPTLSFSASPTTIDNGQSTTLTWSSNASSCTATGGFSTGGKASGSTAAYPTQSSTYQITCSNGSSASANVNITVLNPKIDSFTANPTRVAQGGSATLSWTTSDTQGCALTGPNVSTSGASGSYTASNITSQSTYTLTCQTKGSPISQAVVVNVAPTFQQF